MRSVVKSVKQMFVYGTLMSGERNHKYFKQSIIKIEPATIEAKLYHLTKYNCPTLVLGSGHTTGELVTYEDPDGQIEKSIIALEQDFDGLYYDYVPTVVQTENGKINQNVFVYKIKPEDDAILVSSKWTPNANQ